MDLEPCEGYEPSNSSASPESLDDQPLGHNSKGDLYASVLDREPQTSSAGSDGDSTEEGEDWSAEESSEDEFEELCQIIGPHAARNWRQDQLDNLLSKKTRDYQ